MNNKAWSKFLEPNFSGTSFLGGELGLCVIGLKMDGVLYVNEVFLPVSCIVAH